jgi:hypothetical protein
LRGNGGTRSIHPGTDLWGVVTTDCEEGSFSPAAGQGTAHGLVNGNPKVLDRVDCGLPDVAHGFDRVTDEIAKPAHNVFLKFAK